MTTTHDQAAQEGVSTELGLLARARDLFASAPPPPHLGEAWNRDADRWTADLDSWLTSFPEHVTQQSDPVLPDGEYARVEIMGHDEETGWVTDGTRAGVPVMVVRDWDGRVIREVPGHALFTFVPLPTPLRRPVQQAAITAIADPWDGSEDENPGEPF